MLKEDEIYKEDKKGIKLICPKCNAVKLVQIPKKLVEDSKTLLTISIPTNYVCEHGFQAYIDRWFCVRGYHNADLDLKNLEIYETGSKKVDDVVTYAVSLVIKKIINNLKKHKEDGVILGGSLINQKGDVLYLSLPDEIFLNMIDQVELQKVNREFKLKKMIIELENSQKVFSEFLKVEDSTLTIVILFPSVVSITDAESYLNVFKKFVMEYEDPIELKRKEQLRMKKIEEAQKRKAKRKTPSKFWVYSKITSETPLEELTSIYIDILGIEIDKKNILNIEEIIEISKIKPFEGKIYFSNKFVNLMEGLALTMKDASILLSKLNKMP
ncbi:MAG: hypothetical protein ACFE9I_00130 [Candidatus Hermodarchaeota archaeon]